jgi:UDP-2,4-diacetamido-2,4,6-trideoxy-beta-L-altropyranose hydrolase
VRIAIRTDAAPHTGIGHLMRCLTLADTLQAQGAEVRVVSRHLSPHLRELILARGHAVAMLDPTITDSVTDELSHASWLGTSQAVDAAATLQALGSAPHDWLVVDHYALDARWETSMRIIARRILVVDDVADRRHDCDLLMDQNLFPDGDLRYADKVPSGCALLLGPTYALLRKEFAVLREGTGVRTGPVKRLLVLLGVDVVIGADHSRRESIAATCARSGYDLHVQATHVADLMAAADLALGATGSTSWERCCLGVPTVCMTTGDNQVPIAEGLAASGAILNLGDASRVTDTDLAGVLRRLFDDPDRRAAMSRAARALVDGQGATRVRQRMLELS